MKLNIANNSPLKPSMHSGFRRAEERHNKDAYPTGVERLHRKQPKTVHEILQTAPAK